MDSKRRAEKISGLIRYTVSGKQKSKMTLSIVDRANRRM